jgi:hypothetical protein
VFIDQTEHSIDESPSFLINGGPPVLKMSGDEPTLADPVASLIELRQEYAYVVIAVAAVKDAVGHVQDLDKEAGTKAPTPSAAVPRRGRVVFS